MVFDFFGRRTAFPVGVTILAMATGAPVLPVFVVMEAIENIEESLRLRSILIPLQGKTGKR